MNISDCKLNKGKMLYRLYIKNSYLKIRLSSNYLICCMIGFFGEVHVFSSYIY